MGLFSDKCPQCGGRVRKAARFCSGCGAPSVRADTTCGVCGAELALTSQFCWKCGADQEAMPAPNVIGHRWVRNAEDFAVRVDDVDVPGLLTKGIMIEHGTRAILFQQGKYMGELHEGIRDIGGLLQRINHFNTNVPASIVIMDAGDIAMDLDVSDIRTAENIPVSAFARVVLNVSDPDSLFLNLFKAKKRYTLVELRESLVLELKNTVEIAGAGYSAHDLFGNPQLRQTMETDIQQLMDDIVNRVGLKIVQLRIMRFESPAFEEIRKEKGEIAVEKEKVVLEEEKIGIKEDRIKLAKRLRESLTQEKMDSFKNEKDFEQFLRQTEHELGIKDVLRQDEMQQLTERITHNREKDGILRRIEIMGIEDDARRSREMDELLHEEEKENIRQREMLTRRLETEKNELEARKIKLDITKLEDEYEYIKHQREHEQDFREAMDGLKILDEVKRIKKDEETHRHKLELEKLRALSEAKIEAIISQAGASQAEILRQLEEQRIRVNLSPEQLLAQLAEKSPEAARALAEKYRAESKVTEERLKDMEARIADQKEAADRLERITKEAMAQMGFVASEKVKPPLPGAQTVIAGSGTGIPPVVVGSGGVAPGRICPKCGLSLESKALFCPDCGYKIK